MNKNQKIWTMLVVGIILVIVLIFVGIKFSDPTSITSPTTENPNLESESFEENSEIFGEMDKVIETFES